MKRINIFVEGQTEETFVREVLYEHMRNHNIYLNPILVRTSPTGRGGVVNYEKIKVQINRLCLRDQSSFVTTMFDYFRLPNDFPGMAALSNNMNIFDKVRHIERCFKEDIQHNNFYPNLLVHEFEALLYSDPEKFLGWYDENVVDKLKNDLASFQNPELINSGAETAPSKRILKHCPDYNKPLHGALISIDIGLEKIRRECSHFNQWIDLLVSLNCDEGGEV